MQVGGLSCCVSLFQLVPINNTCSCFIVNAGLSCWKGRQTSAVRNNFTLLNFRRLMYTERTIRLFFICITKATPSQQNTGYRKKINNRNNCFVISTDFKICIQANSGGGGHPISKRAAFSAPRFSLCHSIESLVTTKCLQKDVKTNYLPLEMKRSSLHWNCWK